MFSATSENEPRDGTLAKAHWRLGLGVILAMLACLITSGVGMLALKGRQEVLSSNGVMGWIAEHCWDFLVMGMPALALIMALGAGMLIAFALQATVSAASVDGLGVKTQ